MNDVNLTKFKVNKRISSLRNLTARANDTRISLAHVSGIQNDRAKVIREQPLHSFRNATHWHK